MHSIKCVFKLNVKTSWFSMWVLTAFSAKLMKNFIILYQIIGKIWQTWQFIAHVCTNVTDNH